MNKIWTLAIAPIALGLVVSCTDVAKPLAITNVNDPAPAAATGTPDDGHDAPRISLADAKKEYDAGNAVIVDVRDITAYKNEHIKGSLNIPITDIDANVDKLPKGKKIIAYCS
jgi:3-mercaptopyruvate sulfurtransferase SseA